MINIEFIKYGEYPISLFKKNILPYKLMTDNQIIDNKDLLVKNPDRRSLIKRALNNKVIYYNSELDSIMLPNIIKELSVLSSKEIKDFFFKLRPYEIRKNWGYLRYDYHHILEDVLYTKMNYFSILDYIFFNSRGILNDVIIDEIKLYKIYDDEFPSNIKYITKKYMLDLFKTDNFKRLLSVIKCTNIIFIENSEKLQVLNYLKALLYYNDVNDISCKNELTLIIKEVESFQVIDKLPEYDILLKKD